jgi:hypothetical protein
MKAVRCYEHDLESLAEVHTHARLDLDVLVLPVVEADDAVARQNGIERTAAVRFMASPMRVVLAEEGSPKSPRDGPQACSASCCTRW